MIINPVYDLVLTIDKNNDLWIFDFGKNYENPINFNNIGNSLLDV